MERVAQRSHAVVIRSVHCSDTSFKDGSYARGSHWHREHRQEGKAAGTITTDTELKMSLEEATDAALTNRACTEPARHLVDHVMSLLPEATPERISDPTAPSGPVAHTLTQGGNGAVGRKGSWVISREHKRRAVAPDAAIIMAAILLLASVDAWLRSSAALYAARARPIDRLGSGTRRWHHPPSRRAQKPRFYRMFANALSVLVRGRS